MQTVSADFINAFIDDTMHVNHRVIVEFGSNRFNDGQVVTASSTKAVDNGIDGSVLKDSREFWRASDAFNNKNRNTMKWLVCDRGATVNETEDGTGYRIINLDDNEYERGWWSDTKSNSSGIFAVPEFVRSEFYQSDGTTPFQRRINKMVLYLTEGYRTMKTVSVAYKNTSGTWINVASNYSIPDGTYKAEWDVAGAPLVTGLRVQIHATWDVLDYARISELQGIYEVDVSEDIVSIDVSEVRQDYDQTVPVGITSANDLGISLDNTTGRYNIKNSSSDLYPYIAQNNKINVELGIDINQGVGTPSYEYVPMGEYWVDEWQDSGGDLTATANARDFSKFLQDEVAQTSRVWQDTNVSACITDLMARAGKMPGEEINIDPDALRTFDILFIKDKSIWDFMSEVAFADQGVFGFDRNGHFYYHSYNMLNKAPHNASVYDFRDDREIIDGTVQTELYVNKVIVKVSPVNTTNTGLRQIWEAPESSILSWGKLGAAITSSSTTVPIAATTNQTSALLSDNNWPDKGYFWLPVLDAAGDVVSGEIIKYTSRNEFGFFGCERGYFDTPAVAHAAGDYVGEVAVFEIEFDNAPATKVNRPIVAQIDLITSMEGEGQAQAYVAVWNYDPFGGRLVIGNIVNWYTALQGEAITLANKTDGTSSNDVIYDWYTMIQGEVSVPDDGKQEIGKNNEKNSQNNDYIRRYGKNELTIDNPWIQSKKHAESIADIIIDEYKKPREIINMEALIPLNLELGDRINIFNYPQLDIAGRQYHIISLRTSYDGGLKASVDLREVKSV